MYLAGGSGPGTTATTTLSPWGMAPKLQALGPQRLAELTAILDNVEYVETGLAPFVVAKLEAIGVIIPCSSRIDAEKMVKSVQANIQRRGTAQPIQADPEKLARTKREDAVKTALAKLAEQGANALPENGVRTFQQPSPSHVAVTAKTSCNVIPKDLSARPKRMYMVSTQDDSAGEVVGLQLIKDMVAIAEPEHFQVHVTAQRVSLDTKAALATLAATGRLASNARIEPAFSCWAEDSGEVNDTHVRIPAPTAKGEWEELDKAMMRDRERRGYQPGITEQVNPQVFRSIKRVGTSVAQSGKVAEKQALADILRREVVAHQSHIEGGNLLVGTDAAGELFALVGRDGVAATRARLARELPYLLELPQGEWESYARDVIGKDLGLPAQRVFFVEQPAAFHLDMGILLLGNGIIAVNDSLQVLDIMLGWLPAYTKQLEDEGHQAEDVGRVMDGLSTALRAGLTEMARHEAKAVADIERASEEIAKAGSPHLTVIRVPGSYPSSTITSTMNFFNGEIGTADTGKGYLITNGGSDRRAEQLIAELYLRAQPALEIVYFVSPGASGPSLDSGGGIGCRTKSSVA
jgi:hypothetical protein